MRATVSDCDLRSTRHSDTMSHASSMRTMRNHPRGPNHASSSRRTVVGVPINPEEQMLRDNPTEYFRHKMKNTFRQYGVEADFAARVTAESRLERAPSPLANNRAVVVPQRRVGEEQAARHNASSWGPDLHSDVQSNNSDLNSERDLEGFVEQERSRCELAALARRKNANHQTVHRLGPGVLQYLYQTLASSKGAATTETTRSHTNHHHPHGRSERNSRSSPQSPLTGLAGLRTAAEQPTIDKGSVDLSSSVAGVLHSNSGQSARHSSSHSSAAPTPSHDTVDRIMASRKHVVEEKRAGQLRAYWHGLTGRYTEAAAQEGISSPPSSLRRNGLEPHASFASPPCRYADRMQRRDTTPSFAIPETDSGPMEDDELEEAVQEGGVANRGSAAVTLFEGKLVPASVWNAAEAEARRIHEERHRRKRHAKEEYDAKRKERLQRRFANGAALLHDHEERILCPDEHDDDSDTQNEDNKQPPKRSPPTAVAVRLATPSLRSPQRVNLVTHQTALHQRPRGQQQWFPKELVTATSPRPPSTRHRHATSPQEGKYRPASANSSSARRRAPSKSPLSSHRMTICPTFDVSFDVSY